MDINISGYFQIMGVKKLLDSFPRLIYSTVTFTELRANYCKLLKWLESSEAQRLPLDDVLSSRYWKTLAKNQTFKELKWQENRVCGEEKYLFIDIPYYEALDKGDRVDSAVEMEGTMDYE
jgi:hypothetical protein